jgi:hypothetical protein
MRWGYDGITRSAEPCGDALPSVHEPKNFARICTERLHIITLVRNRERAVSQERSQLFRSTKTPLSLILGCLMLTFGLLKFLNPTIDGWFTVQIQQSHLPHSAILMGKTGEIVTGI